MKETLVVNLLGGPGTGKSTFCAAIFAILKFRGINCEMAREYAKELVWRDELDVLNDQLHVFQEQKKRIDDVKNKVKVVITDSPLIVSLMYNKDNNPHLKDIFINGHHESSNLNIFLTRVKKYEPAGRYQDEKGAKGLDVELKDLLHENGIKYVTYKAYWWNCFVIARMIEKELKKLKVGYGEIF